MTRYTLTALAALLAAGTAFSLPAAAQTPAQPTQTEAVEVPEAGEDSVIATVGDVEIRESDLAFALTDLSEQFGQLPPEQQRVAALSALIDIKLLSERAEEAGMAEDEMFQRRMDFLRQRALHNAYFRDEILANITEEDARARYQQEVEAAPPTEEIRARHILVETEEEAKDIIAQLQDGADFAELAAEHSTDGSSANGGDLGYFQRGQMVPAFEEAAFSLETGNYTETPVESQFGWHVIKLEDRREAEPPAFEQVAGQVRQVLLRERYLEVLREARDAQEIEIVDPALAQAYDAANAPAEGEGAEGSSPGAGDNDAGETDGASGQDGGAQAQ